MPDGALNLVDDFLHILKYRLRFCRKTEIKKITLIQMISNAYRHIEEWASNAMILNTTNLIKV